MVHSLIVFALVAGLVTITPGADTMLVLSTAERGGVGRGMATAAGTVSGVYCWRLAAAAGASAVLTASQHMIVVPLPLPRSRTNGTSGEGNRSLDPQRGV